MSRKSKWIVFAVAGAALFFVSLWGGSWLCAVFPLGTGRNDGSDYAFAAAMSSVIGCVCGLFMAVAGYLNASESKEPKP